MNRAQAFQAAVAEERHRFELLRYQLNPGVLAKSLTTISHEINQNPAAARVMITQLADFYRNTIRQTDQRRPTTIGDEIVLLRAYLKIERLRLGECLRGVSMWTRPCSLTPCHPSCCCLLSKRR